jgi:hypothetical protein
MHSELDYKNGILYQKNRPYTGYAWRVNTIYKDALCSDFFSSETAAKLYAERYLASTGDIAQITKFSVKNGQKYKHE